MNVVALAGEVVVYPRTRHGVAIAQQFSDLGVRDDVRSECGGAAGYRDRVSGVIDLCVVEAHGPREIIGRQVGDSLLRLRRAQTLRSRHSPAVTSYPAQQVIKPNTGCDVGALPVFAQRKEEGQWAHQMRCKSVKQ